jgi:hypothetical protein
METAGWLEKNAQSAFTHTRKLILLSALDELKYALNNMGNISVPTTKGLSRWQASGIHLLISAAIAAATVLLMIKAWFPPPLFTAEGGNELLMILIAVDVVLGPLITLLIFRSGKPGLRFDLTVIGLMQTCALAYGCYVMAVSRPVFIVMAIDEFTVVRAYDLESADIAEARHPDYRSLPLTGPQLVAVELPKDTAALSKIVSEAVSSGKGLHRYPKYFVPYSEYRARALEKSRPLDLLRKGDPGLRERLDKRLAELGRKPDSARYMPLYTRAGTGYALLDAQTGELVMLLPKP